MDNLKYSVDITGKCPMMLIDDVIGKDIGPTGEQTGIIGSEFMRELMYIDSLKPEKITILINSPGGIISDGMQIYHCIRACSTPIETYCIGLAASISAVIFQAGNKRIINDYGIVMVHNPSGGDDKSLKNFKEALLAMMSRSGLDEKTISKFMDKETWFNGNDEKWLNVLWDEVIETESVKTKNIDFSICYNKATEIINEIKNKNESMKVNDVKNVLGITSEVTEAEIISQISDLVNKVSNLETELIENKKKVECENEEDTKKFQDMKKKCEDLENELNSFKKKAEEDKIKNESDEADKKKAEEDKKKNEIELVITDAIKTGKIKEDQTNYWENQLKNSFEETKNIISTLSTNKVGVDISKINTQVELPTNTMTELAKIQANVNKMYQYNK